MIGGARVTACPMTVNEVYVLMQSGEWSEAQSSFWLGSRRACGRAGRCGRSAVVERGGHKIQSALSTSTSQALHFADGDCRGGMKKFDRRCCPSSLLLAPHNQGDAFVYVCHRSEGMALNLFGSRGRPVDTEEAVDDTTAEQLKNIPKTSADPRRGED